MESSAPPDVQTLAGLFAVSGVLHFVIPRWYEAIVPERLPRRRELVFLSGAAEFACAAGLAYAPTRRTAGLASLLLLTAVYPANLKMTSDVFRSGSGMARVAAVARLPMQLPMMHTAYRAWTA